MARRFRFRYVSFTRRSTTVFRAASVRASFVSSPIGRRICGREITLCNSVLYQIVVWSCEVPFLLIKLTNLYSRPIYAYEVSIQ